MSSNDIAIRINNLSKCYSIYDRSQDRLKQSIMPRLKRLVGRQHQNYYHEFWALRDVSFEVKKGETVGIIGRNGSGKSTLLQIICGTLTPTSGTVETNGRVAALLELGSGFNPEFTGRENVYMNGTVLGLKKEEIDSRFEDITEFADIGEFIDQPVKMYSSGMYVRLAFAVAINVDPNILIVDEALSVGDELFQRKCFSRIEAIRNNGATILFVSHSGSTIVELCDRAILLDAGEKLSTGSPKQIVGRYQKLLYAPEEKKEAIRDHIRRMNEHYISSGNNIVESFTPEQNISSEDKLLLNESFDPYLKPSSTIEYESHGVYIDSPAIYSLTGKQVNNLIRGKTYRYTYTVRFSKGASYVRFGMLIKTISGLELGGAISSPNLSQSIPYVSTGESLNIEFSFRAALNPGTYFLNAGVQGIQNKQETYLHRVIDACMFRILPDNGNCSTAIVDFDCIFNLDNSEMNEYGK